MRPGRLGGATVPSKQHHFFDFLRPSRLTDSASTHCLTRLRWGIPEIFDDLDLARKTQPQPRAMSECSQFGFKKNVTSHHTDAGEDGFAAGVLKKHTCAAQLVLQLR